MAILKTILRSRRITLGAACLALTVLPCNSQDLGVVQANGPSEHIELRVQSAPVSQVLAELARKYQLVYKLGPQLSRPLTGNYSGNLRQVLARILDGQNYIVEVGSEHTRVVILTAPEPATRSASTAAPPPARETAQPAAPLSAPAPSPSTLAGAEVPSLRSFLEGQPDAAPAAR